MARQPVTAETPWYEVTEKVHYLNGQLCQPGEKVQYAGRPGRFLVPLQAAVPVKPAKVERAAKSDPRAPAPVETPATSDEEVI